MRDRTLLRFVPVELLRPRTRVPSASHPWLVYMRPIACARLTDGRHSKKVPANLRCLRYCAFRDCARPLRRGQVPVHVLASHMG